MRTINLDPEARSLLESIIEIDRNEADFLEAAADIVRDGSPADRQEVANMMLARATLKRDSIASNMELLS